MSSVYSLERLSKAILTSHIFKAALVFEVLFENYRHSFGHRNNYVNRLFCNCVLSIQALSGSEARGVRMHMGRRFLSQESHDQARLLRKRLKISLLFYVSPTGMKSGKGTGRG